MSGALEERANKSTRESLSGFCRSLEIPASIPADDRLEDRKVSDTIMLRFESDRNSCRSSSSTLTSTMESNFEDYNLKLQTSILNPTKHAFALPTDIQFHKSIDRDLAEEIEACSTKVLSITNKLLTLATSSTMNLGGDGRARLVINQDDVVDGFESVVVDIMDQLLERAVSGTFRPWFHVLPVTGFQDSCLDIIQGHNKAPVISINPNPVETGVCMAKFPPSALLTASQAKTKPSRGRLDPALQHASHITKPQLMFKHKPNNHRDYRWSPSLKHKYHAKVPLGYIHPHDQDESTSRVHVVLLPTRTHTDGVTGRIRTTTR